MVYMYIFYIIHTLYIHKCLSFEGTYQAMTRMDNNFVSLTMVYIIYLYIIYLCIYTIYNIIYICHLKVIFKL